MKKWLCAWLIFTVYVLGNMAMMHTAEQHHLMATLLLGFFIYLIFGLRGVFAVMAAVACIVMLAMCVHEFQARQLNLPHFFQVLFYLLLDLITIGGGAGVAYWLLRMRKKVK